MRDKHCVYMLLCKDNTLYTGYTNNLERRLKLHRLGKAAKYTRGRLPVELVYVEKGNSRSWGLKREYEIKALTRSQKEALIRGCDKAEDTKKL